MSYIFKGNFCGRLCDDYEENLSNVQVKLYRIREDQPATVLATANPKNTFSILSNKQVKAKEKFLLATAETDEVGRFQIKLGDDQDYDGEAFEVDVYIEKAPGQEERPEDVEPIQFTITTLQPRWRRVEEGFIAGWEYCIPYRFWCRIRELLDAWVICGRVVQCQTEAPIGAVTVHAFDRDWIEDDPLGTATTDSSGRFRIDYPASAFKQGTVIDVELFGGPDLYFRVEAGSGDPPLIDENPSRGRASDRENAGACFCVELCADIQVTPPPPPGPTVWTDIGNHRFTIPDEFSLNDFDAQGFGVAGPNHYAFTGNALKMMGSIPYLEDPFTVEYRFRVSDTGGTNGAAPLPEASFTHTVGAGTDIDLFRDNVVLGRVVRLSPFKIVDVKAHKADLDADGWLDIQKAVERAFVDDPDVTPADIPAFIGDPYGGWDPDVLLAIDTKKLAQPVSPGGVSQAGDPVPSSELVDVVNEQRFGLRFEIRRRNTTTGDTTLLPANGTTLNAIILDNTSAVKRLQMVDHATAPCDPLSDQVDVAYTVYHPHLSSAGINVESNEDPPVFDKNLTDANLPLSINQDANGVDPINNGSLNINTSQVGSDQALHKCTYLVTLNLNARLHTGDTGVNLGDPQTTFYYEG